MEYIISSNNNESNHENLESNYEEDAPVFGQFPSPFFDEIPNNGHQHKISSTANEPPPSPSKTTKTKRVRKKRSAGKTDRHSKIHTAQGLRDRRMRLSLNIAHKFFGLQDILGFDKASKTIEWLFCKSKKAIDEVSESHVKLKKTKPSVARENIESCESLSDCEVDSGIEFDATSNKGKQSKKPTESELIARELRDKARARARERTREKTKSKQVFRANPNDDLGFSTNPNNHYIEGSSSSPLEYSSMHHLFDHTQLNNVASSTYYSGYGYNKEFEDPPVGWLNSSNTFLGFLGGWDSENFTENYGLLPNIIPPSIGDNNIHEQSFSGYNIPSYNLVQFQTQNQRD
ncbi:uncharacterized protein LOC143564852 [Bidens hawaiensis]|uniref:uncharacterized protein LOC143564852 n=1 Tax=Bidens hawaiensis TaxID=980011 RepID=UPI00404AA57E